MNTPPAELMLPPPARLSSHHGVCLGEYTFDQQSPDNPQANSSLLKRSKFAASTRVTPLPHGVADSAQDISTSKASMSNGRPSVLEPVPRGYFVLPRLFPEAPWIAQVADPWWRERSDDHISNCDDDIG